MKNCQNCHHRRAFHKKVDGNAWCSVEFCACKQYKEVEVPFERRAMHDDLDKLIDDHFGYDSPPKE